MAASTFGTWGSEWITGVAIGAAEIVWYAVAIDYAIESTLVGLVACGLVAPSVLSGWNLGVMTVKSPVFLCTAAFWIFITGMAGLLRLVGVIVALMRVYAPIALLLLTMTALWALPGLGAYKAEDAVIIARASGLAEQGDSHDSAVSLILGYFALVGLLSVDWGGVAERSRDVVLGGLAGIVVAASWTASMALLVVAGAVGRLRASDRLWEATAAGPSPLSFRWAIWHGVGGYPAGAILILFGLAALAPACYSTWIFSRRFSAHWPRIRRFAWTWIGGAIAFLMVAISWASRLEAIFHAMGLVFAPAVGAMVGDYLRQRGGWAGLRRGINPPGLFAWAAGLGVHAALKIAVIATPWIAGWLPPAPIVGFLTAAIVYWMLAELGLERPSIPAQAFEVAGDQHQVSPATATAGTSLIVTGAEPSPAETCRDREP